MKKRYTDKQRMNWLSKDKDNGALLNPSVGGGMWGLRPARFEECRWSFPTMRKAIDRALLLGITAHPTGNGAMKRKSRHDKA